jgi:hypothetical protein
MEIWHNVQLSRYLIFSVRGWKSVSRDIDPPLWLDVKAVSEAGALSKKVSDSTTESAGARSVTVVVEWTPPRSIDSTARSLFWGIRRTERADVESTAQEVVSRLLSD